MARILIVDDEQNVCNILKDYFSLRRYDVYVAHDGPSALNHVREIRPHVILLDVLMPGMGGMETLREIRKLNSGVGVIMVTAVTDDETMEKARELGADDYIVKPFDLNYVESSVMGKISRALDQAEDKLYESYDQLRKNFDAVVKTLARVVETRDPYTSGHQERVSMLSEAIADEMGLSAERIGITHMAALIHDLGKIYIPAEILTKPSSLNRVEFEMIKSHPQVAYDILKEIEFPHPIAEYIYQHHERMNGSGYPLGLADGNIYLEARIIAVADTIEAMASHRPYRPAIGLEKALEEISVNRGVLYDPEVADACLKLFREKGFVL